jgi:electron transport complex protein RnfD
MAETTAAKETAVPKTPDSFFLGSSPHIASALSARRLMAYVLISLAPVSIFGIVLYGLPALLTILVSVAAAELAEALFRKITRQELRNRDLSAAVTGLLLALILPPDVPLWITALGAVFAVIAAKEFFGGLGANVFNPALIGRAFLLMSFPVAVTTWRTPSLFGAFNAGNAAALADAVSGATPMGLLKSGAGLESLGAGYGGILRTLFLGVHGGCIGESSILLVLAGFIFLLATGTIDWRAPAAMTASVFAFSFVLGRDPLAAVLGGGVAFGAVFMATDYVSAPVTAKGKLIFGFGAGLITALIRQWGNYPEGVTYGILIMNALTPFLNRLYQKKYGYVKPVKGAK